MVFVGMDHGTTGISFCIMDQNENILDIFKIGREESKNKSVSAIEELKKRINLDDIDLIAMTYSMGDGISKILPLHEVKNRGILSINGAGKVTGGGTFIYSELEDSNIPAILIPGLHEHSDSLDELFKASYSHQASSEKVSIAYNAFKETNWKNMVVADISSNSVNILVENEKIKGAIDACIGAMGIIHGPIDLKMIRNIDENINTANECFSRAGAIKIADINGKVVDLKKELLKNYEKGDKKAILAIDSLVMTVAMEIAGLILVSINDIEGIVLTGSIGSLKNPFNFKEKINKYFKNQYKIKVLSPESGSIGACQIAKDVFNGKKDILGIEVDL
ncbi:MAG: methanogenesis marker 12 protein [Methanobacteriaceae archaeon]|nr:methanogenesis marker 12 protein [Methanobacteriaceae archaeon]